MFPDPLTSPAHYAKHLKIASPHILTAEGAEAGDWIRDFSCVVRLRVDDPRTYVDEAEVSPLPFHGFSPAIKSLRVQFVVLPSSRIFDLIHSFPLLEDLTVIAQKMSIDNGDGPKRPPAADRSSDPPALTGSLELYLNEGMRHITRGLLSSPGGIRFRDLTSTWFHTGDPSLTTALVEKCSRTIETLDISSYLRTSI